MGVPPGLWPVLERPFQKEGYSLGPLGKPLPALGSLGALSPDAIAGHWLCATDEGTTCGARS
jgi:hypothetical protein